MDFVQNPVVLCWTTKGSLFGGFPFFGLPLPFVSRFAGFPQFFPSLCRSCASLFVVEVQRSFLFCGEGIDFWQCSYHQVISTHNRPCVSQRSFLSSETTVYCFTFVERNKVRRSTVWQSMEQGTLDVKILALFSWNQLFWLVFWFHSHLCLPLSWPPPPWHHITQHFKKLIEILVGDLSFLFLVGGTVFQHSVKQTGLPKRESDRLSTGSQRKKCFSFVVFSVTVLCDWW